MEIKQEQIGTVTVLDLAGKLTLFDGEDVLRDAVNSALASGSRSIVLRLERVPYIDSAGFGEIVHAYKMVSRKGGKLRLCDPTKRIKDFLRITKLITAFEIVSYEDIAHLDSGQGVIAECPVCDRPTPYTLGSGATPPQDIMPCSVCGTRLIVAESSWPPKVDQDTIQCAGLRMPTYEGEHVDLEVTNQQRIRIEDRLDLFVSESVERLWQILPAPRRVIFNVDHGNASNTGLEKLVNLCMRTADGSRAAIVMSGLPVDRRDELTQNGVVCGDQSQATEMVGTGDFSQLCPSVKIRRG